jgi:hypothetical protein
VNTAHLLADEVFLAAHDDVTGKPRQHPRAIGLGLAGALLGELMLFGRVTTRDGLVVVVASRQPPPDALAHTVLDHLTGEQQPHGLRTWLAFLSQTATERVGARLERAGHVTRTESRRLLKVESRWVPADMSAAAMPSALLRHRLQREDPLDLQAATFAGLVEATGLSQTVLWGVTARTVEYRDWCVSGLPAPLQELIAETTAAVGNAVLTHRA